MFADRLGTLSPSPTLAIQAKAKAMRAAGIDVLALTCEGRHASIVSLDPEVEARTITVNTCSRACAREGLARIETAVRSLGG